ncbi:rhomboid family intramembrane serine protease [Capnocytophaga canimorsus]|uniref:rhomboid family intramembrane serine protease n=1 Tax=Capnocytophaga canimorsus TaxID=28188 RepID=UPI00385CC43D
MNKISKYLREITISEGIILVCVAVFLILKSVTLFGFFAENQISIWVGLSQSTNEVFLKPWTLITYAFHHASFSHLFWNMFLLFFVGQIFLNLFHKKQFLNTYFLGVIFGGITFLLIYGYFSNPLENTVLVGASGGIMCLLIFLCTTVPNYGVNLLFNFRVRLWHIGAFMIVLDILQISSNTSGRIVHLGGALAGLLWGLYTRQLRFKSSKKNWQKLTKKRNASKVLKVQKKSVIQADITKKLSDQQRLKQHKINTILEKINRSGYAALSEEEKKFLFEASKEMNP